VRKEFISFTHGLRAKIIIWSFIPTITILAAVALLTFTAYQQVTEDLVIARDQELTRLSAGQLSAEMKSYVDLLSEVARSPDIHQSNTTRQLTALQNSSNRLVVFDGGVVILDTFGKVIGAVPARPDAIGEDWSDRLYFQQSMLNSNPVLSNVISDGPQNADVVVVAVPITGDQGEVLGILAGMFRMGARAVSSFYGGIVKQRIGESGTTYIVDGNGRVIYHQDAIHIGEDFSGNNVVQRVLAGESGAIRSRDVDGIDTVAGYASIPGTPWGLVTEERWATLTGSVQGYRGFLAVTLILGVFIPIVVVGVGIKRIMDPIEGLINAAKEVARGNFNQTITAKTGDEIEELARQFNLMSLHLQESYNQLEQRVADRTKELAALYRADEELLRHLHLDEVLQALVDVAVDILQADKSALLVWDSQGQRLVVGASRGLNAETVSRVSYAPGEGVVGRVVASGEPAAVEDAHDDPDVLHHITDPEGIQSSMLFPIKTGGKIFGVFTANYLEPRAFGEEEKRLFIALAQRAALAIENAQLYEQAQLVATIEERQRLARELHDAVTQSLFSSSLIAEVLPRLFERNPEEGHKRLDELRQLTRGALAEMRTLLMELRPSALEEAELGDLLRQLREAFVGRSRIPVNFVVEGELDPPRDVKVGLYRIIQEALNNIVKHASASQVDLNLHCAPEGIELSIKDDGRGFDPSDVPFDHLGLGIMRERAQEIGAEIEINTAPGQGTQVSVTWKPKKIMANEQN
jgi:nitrate/nitrite-specific signal transduction histidine kinase